MKGHDQADLLRLPPPLAVSGVTARKRWLTKLHKLVRMGCYDGEGGGECSQDVNQGLKAERLGLLA